MACGAALHGIKNHACATMGMGRQRFGMVKLARFLFAVFSLNPFLTFDFVAFIMRGQNRLSGPGLF
ncbi:MAG: hypothetical protein B5M56_07345 [Desulfococcus sp. 4484_241]|nr:MAG: hypothetical protein B5M56_07345 [Desulfococcus sp. 4484_241]